MTTRAESPAYSEGFHKAVRDFREGKVTLICGDWQAAADEATGYREGRVWAAENLAAEREAGS